MDQTYNGDPELAAAQDYLNQAKTLSASLATSPAQNEARRKEATDLLTNANLKLSVFINRLTPFGWGETSAFKTASSTLIDWIAKIPSTGKEQQTWAQIDAAIGSAISNLTQAKNAWASRAETESRKAAEAIKQRVETFKPIGTTFTAQDWETIDAINQDAQSAIRVCDSYPLRPLNPWNCANAINQSLDALDSKISQLSTKFANQTEQLSRQVGLARQTGRKTANWVDAHKLILLGGIIGLLLLRSQLD